MRLSYRDHTANGTIANCAYMKALLCKLLKYWKQILGAGLLSIPVYCFVALARDCAKNSALADDYYLEVSYNLLEINRLKSELVEKTTIDRTVSLRSEIYDLHKKFGIPRLDKQISNFYQAVKSVRNGRKPNLQDMEYLEDQGKGAVTIIEQIYRSQKVPLDSRQIVSQDTSASTARCWNNLRERGWGIVVDTNS